uniref:Vacuolar ATPase assembly integral membrane protein VMA21 homolog n=1 Tax=Meloidogyne incognita TaxID=6306 RepID=A0A914MDW1_MELIC
MSTHSQSNGESISIVDGDEAIKSQGDVEVTEDKLVSISSVSSSADDRSVGNSTDEDVQDNADLEEREELLATGDELQETDVELIDSGNEVSLLDEKHEAARGRAISRLIGFSLVLIIVPLTAMYLSYRFIFTDSFHLPRDKAVLYGGLVAAALVYVILGLFAWIAYKDEQQTAITDDKTKNVAESKKID